MIESRGRAENKTDRSIHRFSLSAYLESLKIARNSIFDAMPAWWPTDQADVKYFFIARFNLFRKSRSDLSPRRFCFV